MHYSTNFPRILSATAIALLLGTGHAHANEPATSGASATSPTSGASATDSSGSASASGAQQAGTGQLSAQDQQILRDITQSNLAEIRTSELALERAQDAQIKQYAQRLLDDHKKMQERVADLARVKDVQLPQEPSQAQQQTAQQLAQLQGEEFDRAYRKQMGVQAHSRTHDMLRSARTKAEDPQLVALITQAMPVIQDHLATAKDMGPTQASGASGSLQEGESGAGEAASPNNGAAEGASPTSRDTGSAIEGETGAESVSGGSGSTNSFGPGK